MRRSILALSVLVATSFAHADLAEDLQRKNCSNESEACRVIVVPKKVERQGYCVGVFMRSLPCVVSYISVKEGAALNLTCGTDPQNPVINQDMAAEAMGYNVATLISKADGNHIVKNDSNDYSIISNQMVEVKIVDTDVNGVVTTSGEIALTLQAGKVPLTNVTCR